MVNESILSRQAKLQRLSARQTPWDMIVIGGGITGAGIACEAAKRGLEVLLVERQDFSWGTSSRSSKMVHGGLRYIAAGDIKTTMDSVHERERLLTEAQGLVELMPYMMTHYKKQFPPPSLFNILLRAYDFFAHKKYRRFFSTDNTLALSPLIKQEDLIGGTQFADAVTDDSRLVLRVLQEASDLGAVNINYFAVTSLIQTGQKVVGVNLIDGIGGEKYAQYAAVVVNATGTFVDELKSAFAGETHIRPARGSHLVLPFWRLPVAQAYTSIHPEDKRPIFVFPWQGRTVVGTTDIELSQVENKEASISQAEFDYLLTLVNYQFPQANIQTSDVVATWAGVRPLIASGAKNSVKEKRSHSVWDNRGLISVSGGKLTTFRLIALDTLKKAQKYCSKIQLNDMHSPILRAVKPLDVSLYKQVKSRYLKRLQGLYGNQLAAFLQQAAPEDLSEIPATRHLWAELRWACMYENVVHLDDLLLRRVRIGLLLDKGGIAHKKRIQQLCQPVLQWSEATWSDEWRRYQHIWQEHYGLPQ